MPQIPTVPGSQQISTPAASVKYDFNSLNAPNRAQMELGGAIQDVGQVANQFGQQLQAVKNFGLAADADRQMRQATADFQVSLRGRTDEQNWVKDWQDKAQSVRDNILNQQGIGPDLKKQLNKNIAGWSQSNAIEFETMAHKQMINRTVEQVQNDANMAAMHGASDDDITNPILHLADPKVGAMYPEAAKRLAVTMLNKRDQFAADNYISNNAPFAVDWLQAKDKDKNFVNAPRLNPDQRRVKLVEAERLTRSFQANNYNKLGNRIAGINDDGTQTPIANLPGDDEIAQAQANREITATQGQALRNRIKLAGKAPKIEEQPGLAKTISARIADIPQGLDDAARQPYIDAIKTSPEYLKLMGPVQADFDAQIKGLSTPDRQAVALQKQKDNEARDKNGLFLPMAQVTTPSKFHLFSPNEPETTKAVPALDMVDAVRTHGVNGLRSMTDKEIEDNFGKGSTLRGVLAQEEQNWGQYNAAMRAYEKEHPKADEDELDKYSQKLKKPYVMAAVQASLPNVNKTQPDVTKDQYDSLKSGESYWWGGKQLTKK